MFTFQMDAPIFLEKTYLGFNSGKKAFFKKYIYIYERNRQIIYNHWISKETGLWKGKFNEADGNTKTVLVNLIYLRF